MTNASSGPAPLTIRAAGGAVAVQGAAAVVVAVVLLIRTVGTNGNSASVGYGTAGLFVVLGGGVLAAGVVLARSMPGGRGPALVVQVLLLPVAWSLLTASDQVIAGVVLGLVALGIIVLLLAGPSRRWMAEVAPRTPVEDEER